MRTLASKPLKLVLKILRLYNKSYISVKRVAVSENTQDRIIKKEGIRIIVGQIELFPRKHNALVMRVTAVVNPYWMRSLCAIVRIVDMARPTVRG